MNSNKFKTSIYVLALFLIAIPVKANPWRTQAPTQESVCSYLRYVADPCEFSGRPMYASAGFRCNEICTSEGNQGGRCQEKNCECYGCWRGADTGSSLWNYL
ncbi:unnamed protein product [Orchesella dallaii]|uniref:Uncharacterized protein n=1 Tax=Orchesella dallaii TaxID=48710 RepID=A0ABP1S0P2_9HEXA